MRGFKLDNKTMGNLIADVDLEGRKVDEVVAQWVKENQATWNSWIACSQ